MTNPFPPGRKRKLQRKQEVADPVHSQLKDEDGINSQTNKLSTLESEWIIRMALGGTILAAGLWAYFPTLLNMVAAWQEEPDYSHGFLVLPLALLFLWLRRESFPGFGASGWLQGTLLVLVSLVFRLLAGVYFIEAVDGWSVILWLAGCVALVFGFKALKWSAPSIMFLVFMVPLPYRVERLLSLPLQRIAATLSCWGLQLLGQPAIVEGNTILMGDHRLEVEEACSGLRLFVSVLALAIAYLMFVRRAWWENLLLIASVVPIAIIANSTRIIATGLLYNFVSSEAAKHFSHDIAGWAMILLASSLFWLVLWYLGRLFQESEEPDVGRLIRRTGV